MVKDSFRKIFCNKEGKVVIVQLPNVPILLALFFVIGGMLPNLSPELQSLFSILATSFLFVWAYLEITQGVNYFRRALGAVVMIFIIVSFVS